MKVAEYDRLKPANFFIITLFIVPSIHFTQISKFFTQIQQVLY